MDRRLPVLALGMFAMGTDNFVVAGILPSVAASLGTSVSLAGQMVAVYALSFAIMAPVMAAVGGGWPRKPLLVTALAVFVVGNAISALATDLNTVLLSRALAGLGAAMFAPTALGVASTITAPEKRGRALSIVTAGLAGATALGSPLGTFIGGLGTWRTTLWFVAMLGLSAMLAVWWLLDSVRAPERITLRERFAPVRDLRVTLALLTNVFANGGLLMVYTYAGSVLDRVTGGSERILATLLLFWGVSALIGNLASGRLVDRFGSRSVMNASLAIAIINFCALPWASTSVAGAVLCLAIWGFVGWGVIVPQQHRLVKMAPKVAPLLLALNNTATYGGLACSSVLGGLVLLVIDRHYLSLVGAGMILVALALAEVTHGCIVRRSIGVHREPELQTQP
ncbi:MFS transporter [Variovorax sp. J22P240]|uniref:MFS transporter n=1 Tax=unclassified Variovorax TaxID=663243 RepID=UPI0025772DFF|nr:MULTISPECIES: MFS transporter [unclassified Variovorax]MDM0002606.1 MFS transporter [Variovorax sp. J22P240]MDM0049923.1 MFS transporter [Variovorax sp. J22R115]